MEHAVRHAPLVVGLDEAGRSDEAVRAALDLSRRLGAEIFAVHAFPAVLESYGPEEGGGLTASPTALAEVSSRIRDHVLSHLRELVSDSERSDLDVGALLRVKPGPPA